MPSYDIALFVHLLSLLAAVSASSLAAFAALRLRAATTCEEARQWAAFSGKVARVFPIATLGLLASGGYMAHSLGGAPAPWIVSGLVGLVLITVLGAGVEGSRGRALKRELETAGLSEKARRMVRDPLAWSAKGMTLTLVVAIVYIMTDKPSAVGCAAALVLALVAGVLVAMPLWNAPKESPVAETAARRL